jgi:glucosamine kinase
MKLIIDSGSTKADWVFLKGKEAVQFTSAGLNPCFLKREEMVFIIRQSFPGDIDKSSVSEIFFYGAGCAEEAQKAEVNKVFASIFTSAQIYVYIDSMAAVVSTCGNKPGIACIIGTGSNSVFFDGDDIQPNNYGLGFILADEGAGTYLGKKIITHYLYGILPDDLQTDFANDYSLTRDEVISNCYNKPQPNAWLASFSKFLYKHKTHPWVRNTISEGFDEFMHLFVMNYPAYQKYPTHFIGSIAYLYSDLLEVVAKANQINLGKVIQKPMDGLIEYYLNKK